MTAISTLVWRIDGLEDRLANLESAHGIVVADLHAAEEALAEQRKRAAEQDRKASALSRRLNALEEAAN